MYSTCTVYQAETPSTAVLGFNSKKTKFKEMKKISIKHIAALNITVRENNNGKHGVPLLYCL